MPNLRLKKLSIDSSGSVQGGLKGSARALRARGRLKGGRVDRADRTPGAQSMQQAMGVTRERSRMQIELMALEIDWFKSIHEVLVITNH